VKGVTEDMEHENVQHRMAHLAGGHMHHTHNSHVDVDFHELATPAGSNRKEGEHLFPYEKKAFRK
jgi:hypothetical protein